MVELEPCCSSCPLMELSNEQLVAETVERTLCPPSRTTHRQPIQNEQHILSRHNCLLPMIMMIIVIIAIGTEQSLAQNTAKCYSFSPGLTIPGADYRRDYGLSRRQCADVCKSDLCCMAFEWRRRGGQCTLKSRSLNGTVAAVAVASEQIPIEEEVAELPEAKSTPADGSVFFALCVDYGDSDRDRFWDHELSGPVVASAGAIGREKCAQLCGEFSANGGKRERRQRGTDEAEGKKAESGKPGNHHHLFSRRSRNGKRAAVDRNTAVIYSWRSHNPADMESPLGECQCISVLQHIRISFGSFAGFLI